MDLIRPAKTRLHLLKFSVKSGRFRVSNPLQCQSKASYARLVNYRAFSSTVRGHEEQRQHRVAPDPLPQRNSKRSRRSNVFRYVFVGSLGIVAFAFIYNQVGSTSQSAIFEPPRFTPFTITRREIVSPTSILITIRPSIPPNLIPSDPYGESWRRGPWSVEIKQPQLQIARSYTPLPPGADDEPGDLRFLIRREHKGEMSGYLWSLKEGNDIWLRGPKREYELGEDVSDVVFVAGGTGIAPALQVAHTLLERRNGKINPNIRIFWANRRREDCLGGNGSDKQELGPVVRVIDELQRRHPGSLKMTYLVDEDGSYIDQKKISAALKENAGVKSQPIITRIDSKMIFVSGPEGFVEFVAGGKRFEGGKEGQGTLGGLLGRMGIRDWKVWKL
ncbi:Ferredoxin reductase-like, C-terminal NADP-linked [Glarea lozoyensis ATCC 20868]|uniref:Ferredoxin reductase-like, C-terminal NADP-linked n=1 Tax=Glarea lozoyensis (strain ATCC 20868 / MF5171) TaxID=1116229 RepID=S3CWC3_GLAL2|nr:Ferredoxin reductase-like, C-terminal NADP-linked [Glarea lozoyensis ATCC 20868]EPE29935.1 Ferredoxin reductase-like, C-terminal NADP-linked [Glarea lozoyensis ATCC 20868]